MQLREPGIFAVDLQAGRLAGAASAYRKTLGDLAGLYEDEAAFERLVAERGRDFVAYEVTDHKPSAEAGDMIIGVTRMEPGKVGREYFVTRGHIHARANRPEMYYGESGRGLMLLESPGGDVRIVEMAPRTICYVPPFWIHRSVNVGGEPLVMTFAYPADSGQDYDIIARAGGMRRRIVDDGGGGWQAVDNSAWRPRAPELVAAIFAQEA